MDDTVHGLTPNRRQILCLLISVLLMTDQAVIAAPLPSTESTHPQPIYSIDKIIQDPSALEIPFGHCTLKETHKGTNGKLIIHIQDAHANYSGQKSLADILDHFMSRYDLSLVLVEGSASDVTLDEIRGLASLEDWKLIANKFLFNGIISGEEYLNLTTDRSMKLMGIEFNDLYEKGLRAYADMVGLRKDSISYLHKLKPL